MPTTLRNSVALCIHAWSTPLGLSHATRECRTPGNGVRAEQTRLEGIEEQLLAEFREDVLANHVKQMVGHMVRQIMEQRDWVLDQTDVKVQSVPFSKATRYRRPDWFTFHAFRNTGDPRDVVITDRRQNPTLPSGSRWTFYATFASPLKAAVAFGVRDIKQLRQQVHLHGYHRVRIGRVLRSA